MNGCKTWFGRILPLAAVLVILTAIGGCASPGMQPPCPDDRQQLPDCPYANAVDDAEVNRMYRLRTWRAHHTLASHNIDPIEIAKNAKARVHPAQVKIFGPSHEDSVRSLATKIWLIENARYTIDLAYYIYARDVIGYAMLGALCNAVKRGVDVRMMVDSIGSFHPTHSELKALQQCSAEGGFIRNRQGQLTTKRARAQVFVFNALSNVVVPMNRRSHDKLLVVDGKFPEYARVITGGRNVSVDYYGIKEKGEVDPNAFRDLEILLMPPPEQYGAKHTVGSVSENYLTVLYLNEYNKRLTTLFAHKDQARKSQRALTSLKSFAEFDKYYRNIELEMSQGFEFANVRLAHELHNIDSLRVVAEREQNLNSNPNSIVGLMNKAFSQDADIKTLRIVSPYLFLAQYRSPTGEIIYDEKQKMLDWLAEDPQRRVEIVTNSALTSDNFLAQAMIDMDMAPRVLLPDDLYKAWKGDLEEGELNPDIVSSDRWLNAINHPQLKIYQTGKNDAIILGGGTDYGKLHAKFLTTDDHGFVGTTNLDYRSRLYNNEMGFFFESAIVSQQLTDIFEQLKQTSYLWGSPEWLEMRERLRQVDDIKGVTLKRQRATYTNLIMTGLKWQI